MQHAIVLAALLFAHVHASSRFARQHKGSCKKAVVAVTFLEAKFYRVPNAVPDAETPGQGCRQVAIDFTTAAAASMTWHRPLNAAAAQGPICTAVVYTVQKPFTSAATMIQHIVCAHSLTGSALSFNTLSF